MNLIFYPADFNLSYIKEKVRETAAILESKNEPYKLFDYNHNSVIEVADLTKCRTYGRNLSVVLDFIKDYVSKNTNETFNIYLHTDGNSNLYQEIDINEYITENINKFVYIDSKNENFLGEPDFQESWLKNPKFIYIV